MRILRIDIIFLFIILVWTDSAISRSPVKTARQRSNTRKLSLDLSTANDPTELISRAFINTLKDLKKQIQRQQPVTIFFFINPPQNSQEQYVDLIERTLRDLMAQWIFLPMQGFIRTEVKGKNDGTIASLTVIMSILPSEAHQKTKTPNSEFITVDLSKPNVDMMQILHQVLSIAVQNPSIRLNGDMSNLMKLQIIPPAGTTKSSIHNIIGAIDSILIKLLPDTEFSTKASISLDPNGGVNIINCVVNLNQRRDNSFTFTVDISKTSEGLDNGIINIMKNIQQEVEVIFNENKPVILSLKIKPPARSNKKTVAQTIDTVLTTLKKYFPNEIGVTANIYENHKREITFVILDIVIEPKNALRIDLTLPGQSLVDQVNREVSSLKDSLANKKPVDKTTTFTLILKPPTNSDKKTIDNITHVIISTISRIFPDNEISFQTKATKDDRGTVTKMTLVITVEPNFTIESKKKEKVVHIDLLKPGSDVTEELTKILPSLRDMLSEEDATPITLTIFVLPPKGSTEEFMQDTLKTILFILTDNFPEDRITSEVAAKKNPQGFIQNMKVVITVIPSTCTQKPKTGETLNINLTNSEKELVPKIINILPKLNKLIAKNRPANVHLIIQPPKDATDETVQKFVKTIITILSKVYPYNKLEFQVKLVKNPQGTVENVTVLITIEPTDKNVVNELPDLPETINIDLEKPGTKLVEELINIFPSLKHKIKEKQGEGKPVNIKLNIRPPNKATTEYVKKTANTVLTIITKLFPDDDVKVKAKITKDKHGRISEVTFIISINQKPKKPDEKTTPQIHEITTSKTTITTPKPGITTQQPNKVINIDLSRPGKNIPEELTSILTKIKKETPVPKEPISFQLNIEPPTGSNPKFVKDTVDTILTTLTTLYPNEKIKVSAKITKNSDHTIKSISVIFVISPGNKNPEIGSTTPTPKNIHEVKIDLSRPGTNIPKEITTELIKIKPEVTKEMDEDQPLVIKIDIQPPKDSTEEFVKKTINIITTTVSDLFPDKKIVVNVDAIKNPNGFITKLTVVLIIEPSTPTKNPTENTKKPGENNEESSTPISPEDKPSTPKETVPIKIHIDLSKPDTNLVNEVVNILPDIKDEIILKHPKDQPVVVEFDIKPSKKTNEQLVKEAVKTIEKILTTVYPDNEVSYHVNILKDKHDTITNITLVVTIEPSTNTTPPFLVNLVTEETTTETEEVTETTPQTTTPSGEKPIKVKFDLNKPGSSLVTEILTVVPNIEKEVNTKKPVQVEFQVKPTKNSNEQTVKEETKKILEILEQKFPKEKIEIDVKINKRDNVIDTVTYLVTIEPSSSTTTNVEKETTPYTTTKEITDADEGKTTPRREASTTSSVEDNSSKEYTRPEEESSRITTAKTQRTTSTGSENEFEVSTTRKEETSSDIGKQTSLEEFLSTTPSTEEKISKEYTTSGGDETSKITPQDETEEEETTAKGGSGKTPRTTLPVEENTSKESITSSAEETISEENTSTPRGEIEKDKTGRTTSSDENMFDKSTKPGEGTTKSYDKETKPQEESTTVREVTEKTRTQKESSSTTPTDEEWKKTTTRSTTPKEENTKLFTDEEFVTTRKEESTTTSTVYTTPSTKDIDETLTIDLTKPGKTLIEYIEEIIPKVNPKIESKLDENHPVTLEFKVKPPKGSNDDYPKTTTETLVSILTKLYPKNKINVETKVVKTPDGHSKEVVVQVTIEPESTNKETKPEETTTPITTETSTISGKEETKRTTPKSSVSESSTTETKPEEVTEGTRPEKESTTPKEENTKLFTDEEFITTRKEESTTKSTVHTTPSTKDIDETLTIDLTKPGKTLIEYIEEIIPKVTHKIKPKLDENHPVTLEFKIKPPKGSNDDYPKTTTETLVSILTKLYPKNKINVETKVVKTPDGHSKEVVVQVTIEPESTNKETKPEETTTPITTETSTISGKEETIRTTTPKSGVSESSTTKTKPEEVTEGTRPEKESTTPKEENTKLFTDEEFITTRKEESTTTSTVHTTPSTKDIDETLTIDLTKPGKTLIEYIEEIIPKVTHKIEPKLDENHPVTLEFKIKPPKGSNDDYPKTTTETLVSILTKLYPKNKINVETKVVKTPDGHSKEVVVQVTIEPESTNKVTKPGETTTPITTETSTISGKEETKRTTPKSGVSESSTTETKPEEVTEGTRPGKESTTPREENTNKEFTTIKEERSTTKKITSPVSTTPSPKETDETLTIDLTKPGKTLTDYIEEIIPKLFPKIEPKLNQNHPVTLEFVIKPPKGSNDDYPKTTTETLVSILTKLFPKNKISIKTKGVKTPDNQMKKVIVEVIIEPKSPGEIMKPTTTTPFTVSTTPSPKETDETLTIDLTKPGKTLTDYIEEIIPKIFPKIEPKLDHNHPVTLEFVIKPPKGSNDDYPKTTTETLVTILTKLFPENKISIKTKGVKTPDNQMEKVIVEVIIEPKSPEEVMKPTTTTPFTTSYITEEGKEETSPSKVSEHSTTSREGITELVTEETKSWEKTSSTAPSTLEHISEGSTTTKREITSSVTESTSQEEASSTTPETTSSTHENTTPSTDETKESTITFDISKPGKTLTDYIEEIITKIPDVKPHLDENKPVILKFKLKPADGSNENYPKETSEKIVSILTKYFPDDKITVKTHKTPEDEIIFEIVIEPESSKKVTDAGVVDETRPQEKSTFTPSTTSHINEETGEEETTIPIDESKGTTLQTDENIFTKSTTPSEEITEISTEQTKTPLDENSKDFTTPDKDVSKWFTGETTPQTETSAKTPSVPEDIFTKSTTTEDISGWFTEETRPEEKSSSIVPSTTIDDFKESTTPSEKITTSVNFETVPEEEFSSTPRSSTNIDWTTPKSNEEETEVKVDLSKPGTNLGDKIEEIISNILPNIKPALEGKRTITITFKITPPKGSDKVYSDLTTQTLISILTKYFPDEKIDIKTTTEKNPQGYLNEITIQVVVEPSKPDKPQDENIDIDLSKPDSSLSKEISTILPGILPKITTELNNKNPVTLTFTIKPPNKTTESDLKTTIESLHEILTKYFPKNEVKVKLNAKKDPQGHVIQVIVQITIVPTTTQEPTEENVNIDLSKPGTTLLDKIREILPTILKDINDKLSKNQPVNLEFNIKPPTGSTENYLQEISRNLQEIMIKYFPPNKISLKINANKDPQGYITVIHVEITLHPSEITTQPEDDVDIDLTKPGSTLINEVKEKMPNLLKQITDKLNTKNPVTLTFKIKPPTGSTENYLQDLTNSVVTILSKYFPDNKILVKLNAEKNPQGYITLVTIETTLEPSPTSPVEDNNVDIDLTTPGSTVIDQVKEKMPNLLKQITDKLNTKNPVTLTFKIKPPTGSTESYLQDLTNSVVTILSKYFPNNKILVKLNAEKNPQGYITLVTIEITLEPSPTSPVEDNNVDIDLTIPGSTLIDQVREKMPGLLKQITDKLNTKNPVTLTFKIKPPTGSTESYLQDLTNSVVTILSKYFPNNKILVKLNAEKNPQGYITLVTIEITLEPSPTSPVEDNNVDIDLTIPGSTLIDRVREKMPGLLKQITDKLNTKNPVTLTFKIKPPTGSTESYLQDLTNSVVTILSKYFPNNKVLVKLNAEKNPQGYITLVTIEITLEPSPTSPVEDNNVDIDLTIPGSTLIDQVREKMPGLLKQITDKLNTKNPVTLTFKIKPPTGSTESYLQDLTNSVVTILSKYFPNNKVLVKLNAEKNPQGYITLVTIEITLEPSPTSPVEDNNVDIDLTIPGSTLIDQVREKMPGLLKQITDKLNTKNPVTLTFKIKPPTGSTESYLQDLTNSVVTILSKYFPNNKVLVKLNAEKNPQGYITLVTIEITLEPSPTSPVEDNNVDIDLTIPGSTLIDQVREKMPGLLKQITDKLNTKNPVTLTFKIKPPTGSTESYLQDLTNSVVTILSKYFPNNKILVKLNAEKNPQGYITLVTIEITLEPSPTSPVEDNNVDIDLTIPGSTLIDQVREKMPGLLKQITDKLNTKNPVTLTFKIKPPTGSTESYLQDLTNSVVTILSKYFPNNKTLVKLNAEKNPQGYITLVTIEITLEPSSTLPVEENNVDIDLTKPESLIDQVRQKIPNILNQITSNLNNRTPVTLTFKIKPPNRSPENYLQDLTNSVVTILTNYFPNNKIAVKLNAQKDSQGYLTLVTLEITLQPSNPSTNGDDFDIDLAKPGVTLKDEIDKLMPALKQNVTQELSNNRPVILSFKIKPPKGTTSSYLQVISETLQSIIMDYFPNNKVSLEISASKDSQEYITGIMIEIKLEPTSSSLLPPDENVDIDLSKPGVTLTDQISKIMPDILPNITKDLSLKKPVSLSFKIKPPPRSTQSYLQVVSETLEALLAKYLPNSQISVAISAQKNSQNYFTLITIQITIQPPARQIPQGDIEIDLTRPGVNLNDQVGQYLNKISSEVSADLGNGKPVNISIGVKPPYGSRDDYIQVILNSLVPVLSKYFPGYKLNLETRVEKDSQGCISEILLIISIEPSSQTKGYTVDIDLANSRYTLVEQIDNIIPNIYQKIQDDLSSGESVSLSFKVLPPVGSRQDYLESLIQSLVPILTKFFPSNKMSVKTSASKNSQGYLDSITVDITIVTQVQLERVDIDLSRRGSTLQGEVASILPRMIPGLKSDLRRGKPITLRFNIRPPANSNKSFLNTVTNQLVVILPSYFPNNRMSVKTSSTEDGQGFISDIVLLISIQPILSDVD
ncbi:mucin-2-like [Coccinella septempunctata]|uniref:mucin-2-like n=1 Tax=Coccinella septempunctata TaxID=41139 RepID=UPI001D07E5EB|nr:mucin-2-like [Coccinella septempunctata]